MQQINVVHVSPSTRGSDLRQTEKVGSHTINAGFQPYAGGEGTVLFVARVCVCLCCVFV